MVVASVYRAAAKVKIDGHSCIRVARPAQRKTARPGTPSRGSRIRGPKIDYRQIGGWHKLDRVGDHKARGAAVANAHLAVRAGVEVGCHQQHPLAALLSLVD